VIALAAELEKSMVVLDDKKKRVVLPARLR
jgi:hypothetical protein